MTSYFDGLVDFVGSHPQLSFIAVFLLALSEAVPVIGTVVPGSTLILAISALATTAGSKRPWHDRKPPAQKQAFLGMGRTLHEVFRIPRNSRSSNW
jgi:hypothetical protein